MRSLRKIDLVAALAAGLLAPALVLAGAMAHAETISELPGEKIISERTVKLPVELNRAKVKISNRGYGQTYLVKVLVPELADITLMNHRNEGEEAPCMATYETDSLGDIIQHAPDRIQSDFKITLTKGFYLQWADQVNKPNEVICKVYLREDLETTIRGFKFIHSRTSELPDRIAADCK